MVCLVFFFCLLAYFLKIEKGVELKGWKGEEDLEGDEAGETLVRIYGVEKIFFNKKVME